MTMKTQKQIVSKSIFQESNRHCRIVAVTCSLRLWCLLTVGLGITLAATHAAASPLELAGVTVTPHVGTPNVRFRQAPIAPLDARVQLFVWNNPADASEAGRPFRLGRVLFDGKDAAECLKDNRWSWHDSPSVWTDTERVVPPDALTVWTFNSTAVLLNKTLRLQVGDGEGQPEQKFDIAVKKPGLWLSAVTFLGPEESIRPDQMIFYIRNETERALQIEDCRLFLPRNRQTRRWLYEHPWFGTKVRPFFDEGRIGPGEFGGARVLTGLIEPGYGAVEVRLRNEDGTRTSVWGYLRIRNETFDISGGWVNSSTPNGPTLTHVPFLKTLRRMHINTGHIGEIGGYTDKTEPDGLYTCYPLKYFNQFQPIEKYDTDAMLPRIHAVEFLGEPQYGYGRNGKLPQQVLEAFLPYTGSRLATTITLSESQNWHLYAGLSDYPHYDAYRVTAPSPDTWSLYDRWDGQRIRWGSPLETIGEMTRSLRETSRPGSIAYWSQGAHHGWDRYGGRMRTSPTPDELRLQAYHALSSRITSLYWFNLSLKSLVKFRDLIDEITRVGREIRMLERFYLEGSAYRYKQIRHEGKLDWDLTSIVAPDGVLLFALDLDYKPDTAEKIFRFGPPRPASFEFELPPYLQKAADIFRIDADGIHEIRHQATDHGVRIEDQVSKVAVYVAAANPNLREQLESRRQDLLRFEQSFQFDPAGRDADFEILAAFLAQGDQ
jgi:hypothetical protein